MNIIITIKDQEIRVELVKEGQILDYAEIQEERSLSERLLPEMDAILKRNKIDAKEIAEVMVKSDQEDNFTTTRIAKAVANAWNFKSSL